jgi:hypothetical protein
MRLFPVMFLWCAWQATGFSLETRLTALTALKLLPPGAASRVAKIEGRDGDPAPERWHILVHDPTAPRGLREYVVADGAVVADREISQFAETLSAADIIGSSAIKIDSDKAARELQQVASKNSVPLDGINYALQKDAGGNKPVWSVTALDEQGDAIGSVVLSASAGEIVSHEGFSRDAKRDAKSAHTARTSSAGKKSAPKEEAGASHEASSASDDASSDENTRPVAKKTKPARENSRDEAATARTAARRAESSSSPEPVAEGPDREGRRAAPVNEEDEPRRRRPSVGRVLRRLLPF